MRTPRLDANQLARAVGPLAAQPPIAAATEEQGAANTAGQRLGTHDAIMRPSARKGETGYVRGIHDSRVE